jgi:2-oxoglutarate/2-oxoacid ferredoxin oxidoreductase subunit alpha
MAMGDVAMQEELVAPWGEWSRCYQKGRRLLEAGTYALTEGAIAAGCRVFAGYPITPATDIAEYMSKRLPQVGGYYVQAEDELAGMHIAGASLGGLKAMTATSGPGYTLMHDAYGWSIANEIPLVVVDGMRVRPVSGITGTPGQGEFYVARYCSQGGNIETIVLSPASVQEAFWLTIDAFNLAERFRTVVTVLTDQVISDMWEDLFIPEADDALADIVVPRRHNYQMPFYPLNSSDIDVPPNIIGLGTGVCVSACTHTEEGYDIEEMEAQWAQTYRLVNKIRHHKDQILRYEAVGLDDAEVIAVAYGAPARTVKTGVLEARRRGVKAGFLRLISLWPFADDLFSRDTRYLVCELNYDGQLVREVMRAAPDKSKVHFMGKSAELHTVAELVQALDGVVTHNRIPELPYIWTEVK